MKHNFLFILAVFIFISFIFVVFPNHLGPKFKISKNDNIIMVAKNKEYSALILKDKNNREKIEDAPIIPEFKIFNVRVTDKNLELKTTFLFYEEVLVNFDYELPAGNYFFRLEVIPEVDLIQKEDIMRVGNGQTDKNPLSFKIKGNKKIDDVYLESLNILVFQTDNYTSPLFTYNSKINITIKNLKVQLIREDDFTSPLLLGNT